MIDKKKFKKLFNDHLKKAGCKLHSKSWYKDNDETIIVIDLQKSNYSESYFLNIGVWIKQLGEQDFPKERFCHIRMRADTFFHGIGHEVANMLDFSNRDLDDQSCNIITRFIIGNLKPLIHQLGTVHSLVNLYREGKFKNEFVHKRAKEIFTSN